MEFKTVYKFDENSIDKFLHTDKNGNSFLDKKGLDKIIKSGEEYKLLYFVRKSNYEILDDTPVLGAIRFKFLDSIIEGPFVSCPIIKERREYDKNEEEIIKKFIPANNVPKSFEKVEFQKYILKPIEYMSGKDVDLDKIEEFWKDSLKVLKDLSLDVKKEHPRSGLRNYYGSTNDCKIQLQYWKYEHPISFFPNIEIMVLGRENKTQEICEKLKLNKLRDAFSFRVGNQCIKSSKRKGLTYDLSIKNIKNLFEIPENIIL